MRIGLISKYPPIEGGVSSDTYWLARGLGARGHSVSVITNAWEVEDEFRMHIPREELHLLEPENVSVYSTARESWSPQVPGQWSPILRSDYYTEKLTTLAIEAVRKHDIEVLYSHYFLPYGFVGLVSSTLTDTAHVARHAGSDVGRLFDSPFLRTSFVEIMRKADHLLCSRWVADLLSKEGITVPWSPFPRGIDATQFNPGVEPYALPDAFADRDVPLFAYFGKVSEMKKTYAFVDAAALCRDLDFRIMFVVGTGRLVDDLRRYTAEKGLTERCLFLPFVPPWTVPSLMRASTCVVSPEDTEGHGLRTGVHQPKIAREAMACGRCVIMGCGVAEKGMYRDIARDAEAIVVDPADAAQFSSRMREIINEPSNAQRIGEKAYQWSLAHEHFDSYLQQMERIFSSVSRRRG